MLLGLAIMLAEFACLAAPLVVGEAFHLAGAMLFGLVIRLDAATLGTEVIVAAIEHHILAERTLDAAIEQRCLGRGLQADLVKFFTIHGDDPGGPSLEIAFQTSADVAIEFGEIVRFEATTVGGIGYQHTLLGIVDPLGDVAA